MDYLIVYYYKVIEWSKMGPENARVDDVKTDSLQYEGKFSDFVIEHDEP